MNKSKELLEENSTSSKKETYILKFDSNKFKKEFKKTSIPIILTFGFFSVLTSLSIYEQKQCLSILECLSAALIPPIMIVAIGAGILLIVKRKIIKGHQDFIIYIKEKNIYINNFHFGSIDNEKFKIKKNNIFFYKNNWWLNPTYKNRVLIPQHFTNYERLKMELKTYQQATQ